MDELNLDIRNYTIEDLENLFTLNTFDTYKQDDIERKEKELSNKVLSVASKETKKQMLEFIKTAKDILIKEKCEKTDAKNTIISKIVPRQKEDTGYFTGSHNPIEKRIVNKTLCVDTLFRQNYYNTKASDFVYTLPEPITDVVSIQVACCEIAYMWHFISEERKNNKFVIRTSKSLGGTFTSAGATYVRFLPNVIKTYEDHKFTITIPNGNYLSDNFANTLNNIFWNQIVDDDENETNALSYLRCEILATDAKTIIRVNNRYDPQHSSLTFPTPYNDGSPTYDTTFNSEEFSFSIDFRNIDEPTRPIYRNLGWNLGFRKEQYNVDKNSINSSPDSKLVYYNQTNTDLANNPIKPNYNTNVVTNKGYLSSESSYGCLHDNYIYLEIDDYHNNFASDIVVAMDNNSSYLGKNTMARIQLRSNFYTIICENGSDKTFKKRDYYGPIKLEKLNIRLLDRFGKPLDLAQNDYSFVLDIKQYK